MGKDRKQTWYLTASVVLSLIVHLLLYGLFGRIQFMPRMLRDRIHAPSKTVRLTEVRLPEAEAPAPPRRAQLVPLPERLKENPAVPRATLAGVRHPSAEARTRPSLPEKVAATAAIPEAPAILQIDGDRLPPERAEFNRLIIPGIPRAVDTAPAASRGAPQAGPPPPIPLAMRLLPPVPRAGPQLPVIPETRLLPPEKTSILDELIDVRIVKREIPDGGGFFRIDLVPRERAERLQTWRKDIVFIVDVSGSISQAKLNEFTQGIKLAVAQLSPEDRFEIIAFRHRDYSLFGELRHPSPDTLAEAEAFLFKLQRVGSTNIYAALQPIVGGRLKTPGRPLLVFLCSDGQVNYGDIVDSSELINTISNQNQDAVSIFTFSGGGYANPFLMDLISYRNRGESLQTREVARSRQALQNFIGQVADIVVADMDYQVSSHLAADTFPKKLPHLYRGHALSVYGRYPPGTREIGLRLTGLDSAGERQELVYRGDLATATAETGDALDQRWAMQRIYHLYSRLTAAWDENLRHDIQALAAEYRLRAPYLDAYLAPRRANYVE
jgi:hypothetical protein